MAQTIDSKSLSMIQDHMDHEALAFRKCELYANYFTDPQLKSLASDLSKHHKQHFDGLMTYLNSH